MPKKKNAPLKPQPAWLFPPDEDNPALNPKTVDPKEARTAKQEREKALNFLKRRALGVPEKPSPPPQLLNLIAVFLTEYGFNGTCRLFTVERQGRSRLDGWTDELGKKLPKGLPGLVRIYKEWHQEWQDEQDEQDADATSSDADGGAPVNPTTSAETKGDETSSSSSSGGDSDSSSDDGHVSMDDAPPAKKSASKAIQAPTVSKPCTSTASKPLPSASSVSSDSDADDEEESKSKKASPSKTKPKPTTDGTRAASSSDSSSDDETSQEETFVVVKKVANGKEKQAPSTSTSTISKQSLRALALDPTKKRKKSEANPVPSVNGSTDSSATLVGERISKNPGHKIHSSASSSVSSSSASSPSDSASNSDATPSKGSIPAPALKRKRSHSPAPVSNGSKPIKKAKADKPSKSSSATNIAPRPDPTSAATKTKRSSTKDKSTNKPFSRIPDDIRVDERLASNAYVPYDYAERAHQDLIVTRGKGFTKEKNKKKRGSYRGGAIDVDGRKGIKFED
ncbi:MAG: hypothetical protein M1838_003844 [Thelocarpon superellum]|nr:MAG: hypothetical protein M1838_003844 [Thelocarpon superellum]